MRERRFLISIIGLFLQESAFVVSDLLKWLVSFVDKNSAVIKVTSNFCFAG